jgi:Na+-driven multidrug efflux pump
MDHKREGLLTKSMGKLFLELALPAVGGMVAIALYQLVDAIFVGRMVDANALGAVSLVYPLTLINNG